MQKLSEEAKKNKLNYINEYKKANYRQFSTQLKKDVFEEVQKIKDEYNLSNQDILQIFIKEHKNIIKK